MKNNITNERVLAYQLVTLVDENDLHHISGGSNHANTTIFTTSCTGPACSDTATDIATD